MKHFLKSEKSLFFTIAQRKYFFTNELNINELSICKIKIIDITLRIEGYVSCKSCESTRSIDFLSI